MSAPKRLGVTARTPAQRQAERRARGARAIMLPGPVVAQLDAVAVYSADGTRAACMSRLIQEALLEHVERTIRLIDKAIVSRAETT